MRTVIMIFTFMYALVNKIEGDGAVYAGGLMLLFGFIWAILWDIRKDGE